MEFEPAVARIVCSEPARFYAANAEFFLNKKGWRHGQPFANSMPLFSK